jgi:hypothetical protein
MQQQPLEYESPPRTSKYALRRTIGRIASGAWVLFGIASTLLWFIASHEYSLLRPAAVFMAIAMVLAAVLSVIYGGVMARDWFRERANEKR